jgi:hypothetical protein
LTMNTQVTSAGNISQNHGKMLFNHPSVPPEKEHILFSLS